MEGILRDIAYALRGLVRRPAFTLTAVVTLAVTLGFLTAMWGVVQGVLLAPLPYADADGLLVLRESHPEQGIEGFSVPTLTDLVERSTTLETVAAYRNRGYAFTGGEGPIEVPSFQVTPRLFALLHADAARGRTFSDEEGVTGRDKVVVLSHAFWQSQLGGAGDVLGRVVELDAEPYEVVGVMPPGFEFPPDSGARLWSALAFDPEDGHNKSRDVRGLGVLARGGAGLGEVRQELATISATLAADHAESMTGWSMRVLTLHEQLVEGVRARLLLLLGAVAVVVLVAVTNLTNLSLAQLVERQREVAVRLGLGAARGHLLRQFLAESLLLAFAGGLFGLVLAGLGTRWVRGFAPGILPRQDLVELDAGVVFFAAVLAAAVALAFGLLPAWRSGRATLVEHLRSGHAAPLASHRLKSVLVIAQVALALFLTVGAGLFVRSFARLAAVDPGFRADNVLVASFSLPRSKYREGHLRRFFYDTVAAELRAVPGIESVGVVSALPMDEVSVNFDVPFEIEGRPAAEGEETRADFRVATPGYFPTLGIPLVAGRLFDSRDHPEAPPVVLVNETLARRFFPGADPVGQFVSFPMGGRREVVGVVGEVRHYGLASEPRPELYLAFAQRPFTSLAVVARTGGEPEDHAGAVRRAAAKADPGQAVRQLTTLGKIIDRTLFLPRLQMLILVLFAACSVLLAVVGLYGVMASRVAERTQEIGVRVALGASGGDVVWMVIRQGMVLAVAGIGVGLVGAAVLTWLLEAWLYEVDPFEPGVLVAAALTFALVALAANVAPARRALSVDPVVALEAE